MIPLSDFAVMADALLPIGTEKKTIDTELMPLDLVEGEYAKKGKRYTCTSAKLVSPWTDHTNKQIRGIIDLYSNRATHCGTQVNGVEQSEQYRDAAARILTVHDSVKQSHAQMYKSSQQITKDIKNDMEDLGIYGADPSNYEDRYNHIGTGNRGSPLTQARIACSFSNLALALKEEKEAREFDEETKEMEKTAKRLERRIEKMCGSLKTEGTKQEEATIRETETKSQE